MNLTEHLKKKIRDVPDFPKPGIIFKDITPVLQDHKLFGQVIKSFSDRYAPQKIDVIVGIESRGFIFGAPLAYELGCAFVPLRKAGKLPFECQKTSYELEYGTATVEMHIDAVQKGQRVLIIDDLLATGGTATAACQLVEMQGGEIVALAFVVELDFLKGRNKLKGKEIFSLVSY